MNLGRPDKLLGVGELCPAFFLSLINTILSTMPPLTSSSCDLINIQIEKTIYHIVTN